jgi:hypothetical protein
MLKILKALLMPFNMIVKHVLTHSLVLTVNAIRRTTLIDEVHRNAFKSSANYISLNMNRAVLFDHHTKLWNHVMKQRFIEGLFLEFGVHKGKSINFFAELISKDDLLNKKFPIIFGFDSFTGLQEDWAGSINMIKGYFDLKGHYPKVHNNVCLVPGYFSATLAPFLKEHLGIVSFIHMDADTYQSTKEVLNFLVGRIRKGTIIVFDEYTGYPGWEHGEFKAWQEIVKKHRIEYTYLGFSTGAASLMIDKI